MALSRIQENAPSLYKRHFLGYLNNLRTGDLNSALICLRKYFDYSIKNKSTSPVQYSALNLAALYTRLSYTAKALSVRSFLAMINPDSRLFKSECYTRGTKMTRTVYRIYFAGSIRLPFISTTHTNLSAKK